MEEKGTKEKPLTELLTQNLVAESLLKRSIQYANDLRNAETDIEKLYLRLKRDVDALNGFSIDTLIRLPKPLKLQYIDQFVELGIVDGDIKEEEEKINLFDTTLKNFSLQEFRVFAHNLLKGHLDKLGEMPLEEQAEYYETRASSISMALIMFEISGVFEVTPENRLLKLLPKPGVDQYSKVRDLLLYKWEKIKQQLTINPVKTEFKTEARKIAWMHELGVLDVIIGKCKTDNTINIGKIAQSDPLISLQIDPGFSLQTDPPFSL